MNNRAVPMSFPPVTPAGPTGNYRQVAAYLPIL